MKLLAAYLILLVHVMDTSIANVSLVSITTDLQVDAYDSHWILTAFGIGMAGAIPFVPRLVGWLGPRPALLWSLGVSVGSIALCGLATSLPGLAVARFLQGVSSGVVALLLQRLMLAEVGTERRAFGLALWSSAISISPVLGPFVGASITSLLSWRWLFLLQVPLISMASLLLRHDLTWQREGKEAPPNACSAFVLFATMLLLELLLANVMDTAHGDEMLAVACLAGIPLLLLLQSWLLHRSGTRLFDWRIITNPAWRGYMLNASVVGALSVTTSVGYTLWLQVQLQLSVLDVAQILAVSGVIAGLATPLIGKNVDRRIAPWLIGGGLLSFGASFVLAMQVTPDSDRLALVLPRVFLGIGSALSSPAGYMAVAGFEGEQVLAANSLGLFLRTLTSNLFIVSGTEFIRRYEYVWSEEAIANGFGTELFPGLPADPFASMALGQGAGTAAMHALFAVALVIITLALLNLLWLNRRSSSYVASARIA